jgi:hypothetical protein
LLEGIAQVRAGVGTGRAETRRDWVRALEDMSWSTGSWYGSDHGNSKDSPLAIFFGRKV